MRSDCSPKAKAWTWCSTPWGASCSNRRCARFARGGRQVAITSFGDRKVTFDLIDFYRNRSRLLGVNTMALSGPDTAEILEELRPGFDQGHLDPPEITAWPLEQAVEAYGQLPERVPGQARTHPVGLGGAPP